MKQYLNLGCGLDIKKSTDEIKWINTDKFPLKGVDKIMEVNDRWPFENSSTDFIWAHHIIEHVDNPLFFLKEAWRVLKPNADIEIHTPHKSSCAAFHLAHKNYFSMAGFKIIEATRQEYYEWEIGGKFKVARDKLIVFGRYPFLNILPRIIPHYEWFFPASEIEVVLRKVIG